MRIGTRTMAGQRAGMRGGTRGGTRAMTRIRTTIGTTILVRIEMRTGTGMKRGTGISPSLKSLDRLDFVLLPLYSY
jgi:hypothetical protein